MPHLHLCNRAGIRDNAEKSGKPGHNRDIRPNSGTVPAKPGHLATMMCAINTTSYIIVPSLSLIHLYTHTTTGSSKINDPVLMDINTLILKNMHFLVLKV